MGTRPFEARPVAPNISEPIATIEGDRAFPTEDMRRYMEQMVLSVRYQNTDLVKEGSDAAATLADDYYDKTASDARFAPISHTHAAGDVTSGTFVDARIPSLAISKVTGLQTALDGKVAETDIADLNQTISAVPTQAEIQAISDKVDAILAVLRG